MDTPLRALPTLSLSEGTVREQIDATSIIDGWLSSVSQLFEKKDATLVPELFIEQCWWRDLTALAWDITTKAGQASVEQYLIGSSTGVHNLKPSTGSLQPKLSDMGGMIWIESGFSFETKYGSGRGLVRLANVSPTDWKAWTVVTQLEKMKGQDELDASRAREPLASTRFTNVEKEGGNDLQVLIVGAGQCGLALGAELKNMGVKAVIVDRASKIGGGWLQRYDTVTTHTASYSDHFPFMKFPENWPVWLHRDKIISWMNHYADIMGLDIKLNSLVKSIDYDSTKRQYKVEIEGQPTLTPRHLVLATGLVTYSNDNSKLPSLPNQDKFNGKAYYALLHKSASEIPDLASKRVAIIGVGTAGHDIAQDYVNSGAKSVTMIQRGPIFSMTSQTTEKTFFAPFKMMPTEDADLTMQSLPHEVLRTMNLGMTKMISQLDKPVLDGLEKAGLDLKRGEDGIPVIDYQLKKLGGAYIDQGANNMIIDGRIKIRRCADGMKEFYEQGIVLGDGSKVEADVVVLATGMEKGASNVERIMGKDFVDKVGNLDAIQEDGERLGWWRPTKAPGFWYMVGNFFLSRQFSRILALQINGIEQGFNADYYQAYEGLKN